MNPPTLVEKQNTFAFNVARLILELSKRGYAVSLGEAWRSPETCELYAKAGKGISASLHIDRLAIDLVLRRNGVLLDKTPQYKEAGDIWKSYSNASFSCCWGGDFQAPAKPDGNHFSVAYQGRK